MIPTKTYSNKHERLVADALGWGVVCASGARNFHPGDISSRSWLGECKTHTQETSTITFYEDVWMKIEEEADCERKDPALFVDNGTQSLTGTWVMFDMNRSKGDFDYIVVNQSSYPELSKIIRGSRNVSFDHIDLMYLYKKIKRLKSEAGLSDMVVIQPGKMKCNINLVICPLTEFVERFGI